ncbi:Nibrin [Frankliniella fusca]|uniref:Nibrin n=1 Tax=Frankliniella fusca TaxID=407009 RepID=A0AAE1I435_9NEOP|nr:Nibrin [Frankliniella fusca]
MWCLVSSNGQESYNVTPGRVHTVSRKVGDIILANDQSVSRKHAFLEVKYPITDGIYIWDESSKYGSFIDDGIESNSRLVLHKKYTLKEGGTVRFGLQQNTWVLKREIPCVLGHNLKAAEIKKIVSAISKTGGKYVGAWTKEITHLCASTVSLSCEVMCALASAKPIVTPLFWEHYSSMLAGKGALADPSKFIPAVHDSQMSGRENLWLPNTARKSLFKDKLFLLPNSKNFEELKTVIELAGGEVNKLSDCKQPLEEFCKPNIIVVKCAKASQETKLYREILNKFSTNKWQAIPEEDIGLAIWKVSTEKHCNPAFSSTNILNKLKETPSQPDSGATLVLNTEDVRGTFTGQTQTNQTDLVIPPSCSENNFTSDDKTESFNPNPTNETMTEITKHTPGPSRKRERDSEKIPANTDNKNINSASLRSEPHSLGDEDLFADDLPKQRNNCSLNSTVNSPLKKSEKKPACVVDDDDFSLPSPPKRKKPKKSVVEDDMFDLPEPPPKTTGMISKDDDDEFFLPSPTKKPLLNLSKLNQSANYSALNESNDLFECLESEASTSRSGKRKDRNDSETEDPPRKRPTNVCVDVTNVQEAAPSQHKASDFICKTDIKHIKKEENGPKPTDEEEISFQLHAKVVLRPLITKKNGHQNANNSKNNNVAVKNFKKFRKNWGGNTSGDRHQKTTSRVLITTVATKSRSSFSTNANSDDEDDPFTPDRPGQRLSNVSRRININDSDDDDEFALPSFSQV